jgi:hypothetical protein
MIERMLVAGVNDGATLTEAVGELFGRAAAWATEQPTLH